MRWLNKFSVPLIASALILYWLFQRGPTYLSSYFAALEVQALQDAARLYGGRFMAYIPRHLHPPLTSAMLGLWTQLGDSEKVLRLFPVACAVGTLTIYTSLLRSKYSLATAAMAGLFFVCSWGFVVCHVGVLNYGWPLLLSMGMIALYAKHLEKRQTQLLMALGILTTIGIFSNYTIVFLAVALWASLCVHDWSEQGRVKALTALTAFVAIVPGTLWIFWHKSQLPLDTAAYLVPRSLGGGDFFKALLQGTCHLLLLLFPCEWHGITQSSFFLILFLPLLFFKSSRSRWILLPTGICTASFLVASLLLKFPWDTSRHRFPLIALYSLLIADVCIQTLLQVRPPARKHAMAMVGLLTLATAFSHLFFADWEASSSKLRDPRDLARWRAALLADRRTIVSDQATRDRLSWYIDHRGFSGFHFPLFPEQIQYSLPFRIALAPVWNFQKEESCKALDDLLGANTPPGGWRATSLADIADNYQPPLPCMTARPGAQVWQTSSAFIVNYN